MRLLPVAAVGLTIAVVAGGATASAVGVSRQSAYGARASALEHRWNTLLAEGVPAASIAPLRDTLHASKYATGWWSPVWWSSSGGSVLDDLQRRTDDVWSATLASARQQAQLAISRWSDLLQEWGQYVPDDARRAATFWPVELARASTPRAITHLSAAWSGNVTVARDAAVLNKLNAEVSAYGGVSGLLAQAAAAVATAQRDNLDPGQVPALSATLRDQVDRSVYATDTLQGLVNALSTLRALISLNNSVGSGVHPLIWLVDQAAAEQTPNAQALRAQVNSLAAAFRDAREPSQLRAVSQEITSLQSTINAELSANRCGHDVGAGKVITLNLTLQEMVFYEDGCAVQAAPTTTGRAYLRTPAGHFSVFRKASPWTMVSPWPPGSPFWYPTGTVRWVMEFAGGGYFIHDAYWEAGSQYGPGSENGGASSHGCVHIPTPVMQWAFDWTPLGTPVIISY